MLQYVRHFNYYWVAAYTNVSQTFSLNNFYLCNVHFLIYILFTHQQMYFLFNLEKFKFIIKYTLLSLLHVSVFDHPQGACTEPG